MDNVTVDTPVEPATAPAVAVEPVSSFYESANLYILLNPLTHDGEPLKVDGQVIKRLKIRKLRPFELQGVNLVDVGMGDVPMILELLKRSSDPYLDIKVNELDLPVITEAAGVFKRFFTMRSAAGTVMSAD
jgi:hypothetical protein